MLTFDSKQRKDYDDAQYLAMADKRKEDYDKKQAAIEDYTQCVTNNLEVMNEALGKTMVRSIPNSDLLKSYILPQNKAI